MTNLNRVAILSFAAIAPLAFWFFVSAFAAPAGEYGPMGFLRLPIVMLLLIGFAAQTIDSRRQRRQAAIKR